MTIHFHGNQRQKSFGHREIRTMIQTLIEKVWDSSDLRLVFS